MPSAARVLAVARQKRCRCQVDGPLTCAECDGLLHVVSKRTQREELLRNAVSEAARQYLAAQLLLERAVVRHEESGDLEMYRDDALQSLRDACAAERKVPRG